MPARLSAQSFTMHTASGRASKRIMETKRTIFLFSVESIAGSRINTEKSIRPWRKTKKLLSFFLNNSKTLYLKSKIQRNEITTIIIVRIVSIPFRRIVGFSAEPIGSQTAQRLIVQSSFLPYCRCGLRAIEGIPERDRQVSDDEKYDN